MLSEKCNAFSRPLKKKAFKEERGTTIGLYAIGTSTPLESNKSHVLDTERHAMQRPNVSLSCRQDLRRFREHAPKCQPWQGAARVPGFSAPHRCAVHQKALDFYGWRMYFAGGSTLARPRPEGGQAQCRARTYAMRNG